MYSRQCRHILVVLNCVITVQGMLMPSTAVAQGSISPSWCFKNATLYHMNYTLRTLRGITKLIPYKLFVSILFRCRNTVWDCVIVVQGMPSTSVRKSLGVEWRSFHIRDTDVHTVEQSKEACGKAYVTMYRGMSSIDGFIFNIFKQSNS